MRSFITASISLLLILNLLNCKTTFKEVQTHTPLILENSQINIKTTPKIVSAIMQDQAVVGKASSTSILGITTDGGVKEIFFNHLNTEGYGPIELAAVSNAIEKSGADSLQVTRIIIEKKKFIFSSETTATVVGYPIKFKFQ